MLPILAAIVIAVAPGQIAKRYASMFNMNDPTVHDRYTMLHIGERMIAAHPLTGVGPNMVERLYVDYKGPDSLVGPDGVTHINPHLHNDFTPDRRRAWPASARAVDLVHRRADARLVEAVPRRPAGARGDGDGHRRRAADRRAVRVQLRRLRSADAVPHDRHAARGRRPSVVADDAAAARRRTRARLSSNDSPAFPFSSPAT